MHDTLLLILSDDLRALVEKGEIVDRYYNPNNLFKTIVVISTVNNDLPQGAMSLFGDAKVLFYNFNRLLLLKCLVNYMINKKVFKINIVDKVLSRRPRVVRLYGLNVNGLLGLYFKKFYSMPLVCSIHAVNDRRRFLGMKKYNRFSRRYWALFLRGLVLTAIEKQVCLNADKVIAVYESIIPFALANGAKNVEVIYNSVSQKIKIKETYEQSQMFKLLNVGVQVENIKEPSKIVLAAINMPVELIIYGEGNYHSRLVDLVDKSNATNVHLNKSIRNDKLMDQLHDYDICVYRTSALELSKSVIEAMLAGLPIIVNNIEGITVPDNIKATTIPEYSKIKGIYFVEDTIEGWRTGIENLVKSKNLRESLGKEARKYAIDNFEPTKMEKRHALLYAELIKMHNPKQN